MSPSAKNVKRHPCYQNHVAESLSHHPTIISDGEYDSPAPATNTFRLGDAKSHSPNHESAVNGETKLSKQSHPKPDYSSAFTPSPALVSSRYNRQILVPDISVTGQEKISHARILIVGLGGLGSPASLYLAGAGIGKLGLLDDDAVETSNLHRQIAHSEASVEQRLSKVESARRICRALNSEIDIIAHEMRFDISTRENAQRILDTVDGYDIVLDCSDNPATRYLVSDICVIQNKPLVSGAAQRLEGQLTVLNWPMEKCERTGRSPWRGPCYRCIFPQPPPPESVRSCGEIGILGPVVGTIGTMMATETLRLVVRGFHEAGRKPTLLMYSAWPKFGEGGGKSWMNCTLPGRRVGCLACGSDEDLEKLGKQRINREALLDGRYDYRDFCGRLDAGRMLDVEKRIQPKEFLDVLSNRTVSADESVHTSENSTEWKNPVIIDLRDDDEKAIGPVIHGSVHVPYSRIHWSEEQTMEKLAALSNDESKDAMLFVCQRGNDSQYIANKIIQLQKEHVTTKGAKTPKDVCASSGFNKEIFVGDVLGGFSALDRAVD